MKNQRVSQINLNGELFQNLALPTAFLNEEGEIVFLNEGFRNYFYWKDIQLHQKLFDILFEELEITIPVNFNNFNNENIYTPIFLKNANDKSKVDNLYIIKFSSDYLPDVRYFVWLSEFVEGDNPFLSSQRHLDYLKLINKMASQVINFEDVESLSGFIVKELHNEKYNFYHVSILLRNENYQGNEVSLIAVEGESREFFETSFSEKYRQSVNVGVVGKVIRDKLPIFVKLANEVDYYHSLPEFKSNSELCVPIFLMNDVIGVINIESKKETDFDQADVAILQTVANLFSMSVQKMQITNEIRQKNSDLELYLENVQESKRKLEARSSELISTLENVEQARSLIERQNRQMLQELKMASELQKSLLPRKFPDNPSFNFTFRYETTSQLGGDFFDVMDLDEHHLGIIIADVSGHGVSSALIAAMFKAFFTNFHGISQSPSRVLSRLNNEFCQILSNGEFITAFYMIIDTRDFSAIYSNAGHSYPLRFNINDSVIEELDTLGFFLGVFENTVYEDKQAWLQPGDKILFYTDGLTEAKNAEFKEFNRSRLREHFLTYSLDNHSEQNIVNRLFQDLKHFSNESMLEDDVTLLLLENQPS